MDKLMHEKKIIRQKVEELNYTGSLSNSGHGEKQEMKSRQHFAA